MGGVRTALSRVRENGHWRVEITWPNGIKHYFGKFASEHGATGWITKHLWLTEHVVEEIPEFAAAAAKKTPPLR